MANCLIIYLALFLVVRVSHNLSVPLTIGPSTKYSISGTNVVIIGVHIFPASNYSGPTSVNPLLYSIPLPKTMNDTNYKSTISVQ